MARLMSEMREPCLFHAQLLGDVELFDVETRTGCSATVTERVVGRYRQLYAEFQASVGRYCSRHGIPHTRVACNAEEDEVVLEVLGAKQQKTRP